MENESAAFHEKVRAAYRDLADRFGWTVVAADADPDVVADRVWAAVEPVLGRRSPSSIGPIGTG